MGRPRRKGPRPSARHSGAVPTWARVRLARVPPAAAGRAADPPGSAELGSASGPRAPTSSRPGARVRAGRRRPEELERGREGEAVGEELRAGGEKEGSRSEKEEGVVGTCRCGRFTRQSRSARRSARGRPAPPRLQLRQTPAGCCHVCVTQRVDRSLALQSAFERQDPGHLLLFATSCLTVLSNPHLEPDFLLESAHLNLAHQTLGA